MTAPGPGSPYDEAARTVAADMGISPALTMTDEQVAEFRERFEAVVRDPGFHSRVLPQPAPLTRDEIRSLLRECVTAVAPGETLVVRTTDLTPSQMREYQQSADCWHEDGWLPFRVLIVHGDGLGVRQSPEDPPAEHAAGGVQ